MGSSNKIGLGTVQFGLPYGISNKNGQTSANEVENILKLAKKKGIDVLDSASAYGNAEEVLGENNLQEFKVVSKFMPPSTGRKISLQLKDSLRNLKIPSLYAYLAHRPIDILKFPDQWDELNNCKEKGKVEKIGFSLNKPEELESLLNNGFMPDLVQVPYNYFDRRFEEHFNELKRIGCEVHSRSAFLQGLFFIGPDDLEDFFDEVKPLLYKLQEQKKSLPGKLLKFVIKNPAIDKVIIGVENDRQLAQNLEGIEEPSSLPELRQIVSNRILMPSGWPKK